MTDRTSRAGTLVLLLLAAPVLVRAQEAQETLPGLGRFGAPRWLHELNEKGIHVKPGSFAEGSGFALPVSYWKPDMGGKGLDLFATAARSVSGNNFFEVRVGRVPHRPGRIPPRRDGLELLPSFGSDSSRFFIYGRARSREADQDLFLGEGSTRASYKLRDGSYDLVAGYQLGRRWAASARVGYLDVKLGEASWTMPSAGGSFFRVGAELAFDDRDEPANPHAGGFLSLALDRYDGLAGAPVAFHRASLDARRFVSLGSRRHVLALRALGSADFREEGRVPFYLSESLGGSFTLRGYDRFRFRGDQIFTVSGEYRFEARRFLEVALFYDAGQAWGDSTRESSGFRTNYGFGLRLKTARSVILRLDVARGGEGPQAHLKFGYSF